MTVATFVVGTQKYDIDRYAVKNGAAKRPAVVMLHGVDGMDSESGKEIGKFAGQIAGEGIPAFRPSWLRIRRRAETLQCGIPERDRISILSARAVWRRENLGCLNCVSLANENPHPSLAVDTLPKDRE